MTVASAEAEKGNEVASRLAPGIPPSLVFAAMAQVGEAAAEGGSPGPRTKQLLRSISARAPLQPEPFLVEAALAERAGELDRAAALLKAARWREPRSAAARYLYSEVLIAQGKVEEGVGELAALTQIVPATGIQLVPALASYARQPNARQNLGRMLQINPQLKQPLLIALSADTANADLIVFLAGPNPSVERGAKVWESRLLRGLVNQGNYARAYDIWKAFAGAAVAGRPLLFNPDFQKIDAPPPFNWGYGSSPAGFAEPANGTLRVFYYGRQDVVLASQLLLLRPGAYRFSAPVQNSREIDELAWTLSCGSGTPVLSVKAGAAAKLFRVPVGCAAQRLTLLGVAQDAPIDVDVQVGPVTLQVVAL